MKKNNMTLFIVVGSIIFGLFLVNRWIVKQMDVIENDTSNKITISEKLDLEQNGRQGIPVIDPLNDPLAPVVKKQKASVKRITTETSVKKYEISDPSPILVQ